MKISGLLGLIGAAIAGIYLTSEEGKSARLALNKRKSALEPIIKDLLEQANEVIGGAKELNSDEIRANIELLTNEAKDFLVNLDLEKTVDTIKHAIRVASQKINEASNEVEKEKRIEKKAAKKIIMLKTKQIPKKNTISKTQLIRSKSVNNKKISMKKKEN